MNRAAAPTARAVNGDPRCILSSTAHKSPTAQPHTPHRLHLLIIPILLALSLTWWLLPEMHPWVNEVLEYGVPRSRWGLGQGGGPHGLGQRNILNAPTVTLPTRASPPPLTRRTATQLPVEGANASDESATSLRCWTLEAYSDTFLLRDLERRRWLSAPSPLPTPPRFFGCGVRVSDLRTEHRAEYRQACAATTPDPYHDNVATLRVVLTTKEVRWHEAARVNLARQRIPLSQFNDDYCDCLDGTDELLTNACSMAGWWFVLSGTRWPQYVQANQHVPLYEDEWAATAAQRAARVATRVHSLGGPVLPFRCTSDAATLLAPSAVGDGIVDCCDASDEQALQHHPYLSARPAHAARLETARAAVLREWQSRVQYGEAAGWVRDEINEQNAHTAMRYQDALHPHYTTPAALLEERGYGAGLLQCSALRQTRLRSARALYAVVQKGHAEWRQRVDQGWARLGREMAHETAELRAELVNVSRALAQWRGAVAVGRVPQTVQQRERDGVRRMTAYAQSLAMRYELHELLRTQHVFGADFEFYPLVAAPLVVNASAVEFAAAKTDTLRRFRPARHRRLSRPELHALFAQGADAVMARLHVGQVAVHHWTLYHARGIDAVVNSGDDANGEHVPLGLWQPMLTENTTAGFHLLDPAGDTDLPRRLFMRPRTTLTRGMGRLQWPTRRAELPHYFARPSLDDVAESETGRDSAQRARERAQRDDSSSVDQVRVGHFLNTPNVAAVHVFAEGVRCGTDAEPTARSHGRVVYVCDVADRVLRWGRDGPCAHEIVVGTPSACAPWVLHAAHERLRLAIEDAS